MSKLISVRTMYFGRPLVSCKAFPTYKPTIPTAANSTPDIVSTTTIKLVHPDVAPPLTI